VKPSDRTVRFVFKPTVFLAPLGPFFYPVWAAYGGRLSANPLADLTNETGVWTVRFLCITLAITPLRKLTGWSPFVKFRRMAGLFVFFYVTLHLMIYANRPLGLVEAVADHSSTGRLLLPDRNANVASRECGSRFTEVHDVAGCAWAEPLSARLKSTQGVLGEERFDRQLFDRLAFGLTRSARDRLGARHVFRAGATVAHTISVSTLDRTPESSAELRDGCWRFETKRMPSAS
jgi:hypothetical protein